MVSAVAKLKPAKILAKLQERIGHQHAIHAADLVVELCSKCSPYLTRRLRERITALRDAGWPICAKPEFGYWWAASAADLEANIAYHRKRGIASLRQGSRQRRWGIPILAGQLRILDPELTTPGAAAPVEPVPELLMTEIPEDLNDALEGWLEAHPDWDLARATTAALALFLMQGGDAAAKRAYLDTHFGEQ